MNTPRTIAIALLAALATVLVVAAVVLLAGGDGNAPIQIMLPTPDEALSNGGSESGPLQQSPKVEAELKVDIRGAVQNPGVYTLHRGARLEDAVKAAAVLGILALPCFANRSTGDRRTE